jgi:hypothetical protein
MRRPPASLVPFVLAVLVAASSVSTPAQAGQSHTGSTLRQLDARIRDAEEHIRTWDRRIVRWNRKVGKVSVKVQQVRQREATLGSGPPLDVLSRHTPRSRLFPYLAARAERAFRAILHDPEAKNAQQQIAAWLAYLGQLNIAREALASRPDRGDDDAPGIVPGEPITYEGWARAFLSRLDAPDCAENLMIVVTWETSESTSAAFNPLATTHDMDGATDFNSVGVKNYLSLEQGLDAARDTLLGGAESYGYAAIIDSLRACTSAEKTALAINASAWCRGCTGGAYITGLLPIVRGDYPDHAARLISTQPG